MRGTQFRAAQTVQILITHGTTYWRTNQLHVASKLPYKHYTLVSSTPSTDTSSHMRTNNTSIAIQKLAPNTILDTPPTEIHQSEHTPLLRADRVHLCRLRCGHHTALATYQKRIYDSVDEVYIHCSTNTHCPALTHIRAQHNISSPIDLWHSPAKCLLLISEADLLRNHNNSNCNVAATCLPPVNREWVLRRVATLSKQCVRNLRVL